MFFGPKGGSDANDLAVSEMRWSGGSHSAAVVEGNEAFESQNEAVEKTSVPWPIGKRPMKK